MCSYIICIISNFICSLAIRTTKQIPIRTDGFQTLVSYCYIARVAALLMDLKLKTKKPVHGIWQNCIKLFAALLENL